MGGWSQWYWKFLQFNYTVNSPQWLFGKSPSVLPFCFISVSGIPKDLDFHKDSWNLRCYHKENWSIPVFKNHQTKQKNNRYLFFFFFDLSRILGALLAQRLKCGIYPFKQSKADTTNKRTFCKSASGHAWQLSPAAPRRSTLLCLYVYGTVISGEMINSVGI